MDITQAFEKAHARKSAGKPVHSKTWRMLLYPDIWRRVPAGLVGLLAVRGAQGTARPTLLMLSGLSEVIHLDPINSLAK
jgi:hypothetical protein